MAIEKMLERYFNADTTLSEERQLREFFASDHVPPHLEQYRAMFAAIGHGAERRDKAPRGAAKAVRAHRITFGERVAPLLRVAACVAVVVSVLMAAEQGMRTPAGVDVLEPSNTQNVGAEVSELGTPAIVADVDTLAIQ